MELLKQGTKENPYAVLKAYNLVGRRRGEVVYCRDASLEAIATAYMRGVGVKIVKEK